MHAQNNEVTYQDSNLNYEYRKETQLQLYYNSTFFKLK